MTNNQAGRLKKYKDQERFILGYLVLAQAILNYRAGSHSIERTVYSYYQIQYHTEKLNEIEDMLVQRGLSRQKLRRMKTLVRALSKYKTVDLNIIDPISKYGVMLFLNNVRFEGCQFQRTYQPRKEFYDDYNRMITRRRTAALKARSISQAAIIRNGMNRLKKLYIELKPNGQNVYEFMNDTIDKVEQDEHYLPGLVKKARLLNPAYVY